MKIVALTATDTSNYTCRGVNAGGEDSKNGTVIVECKWTDDVTPF